MTEPNTKNNPSFESTEDPFQPLYDDIHEVVITSDQIYETIQRLTIMIQKAYAEHDTVVIPYLLKGAKHFADDLSSALNDAKFRFMPLEVSSYKGGTCSTGQVDINTLTDDDITGHPLLIVDDIYDSGLTLKEVTAHFQTMNPSEIKTCVMFEKDCEHAHEVVLDFVGLKVPDDFIVGYGLDYQERYRELKCVGKLKPEIIDSEDQETYAQPV